MTRRRCHRPGMTLSPCWVAGPLGSLRGFGRERLRRWCRGTVARRAARRGDGARASGRRACACRGGPGRHRLLRRVGVGVAGCSQLRAVRQTRRARRPRRPVARAGASGGDAGSVDPDLEVIGVVGAAPGRAPRDLRGAVAPHRDRPRLPAGDRPPPAPRPAPLRSANSRCPAPIRVGASVSMSASAATRPRSRSATR
jgi:hypothetical protein